MRFNVSDALAYRGGIYAIRTEQGDQVYVGATVSFKSRYVGHSSTLRSASHKNIDLQALCDKVGADSLTFEVLEVVEAGESMREAEQKWMESFAPELLLNRTPVSYLPVNHPTQRRTEEKRTERVVPVTFASVAEKKAAQAHAASKGQTLAGLLKLLLSADMKP